MHTSTTRNRRGIGLGIAVLLGLALAGCTAAAPESDDVAEGDSAAFVACLTASGVDAKISDQGYVLVRIGEPVSGDTSISSESGSGGEPALLQAADEEGTWVAAGSAAYFVDDPDTQDVYAGCETRHPDFAQPEFDPADDPAVRELLEQQRAAALEFARCARGEGFAWVADPDAETGAIALPADLTETEFRAALTACADAEGSGFAWSLPGDELSFDWQAVLAEFLGGSGSVSVTEDEG